MEDKCVWALNTYHPRSRSQKEAEPRRAGTSKLLLFTDIDFPSSLPSFNSKCCNSCHSQHKRGIKVVSITGKSASIISKHAMKQEPGESSQSGSQSQQATTAQTTAPTPQFQSTQWGGHRMYHKARRKTFYVMLKATLHSQKSQ